MCAHINTAAESLARNLAEAATHTDASCVKEYFVAFALDTIAGTAFGIQIDSQKDFSQPFVVNATKGFTSGFFYNIIFLFSGLSSDEICAQVCLFFGAGFEAVSTSLQFMAYVLATHPTVQRKLVEAIDSEIGDEEPTYDNIQKIEYLEHFIRETLRLYPSVPLIARETAWLEIKGYTFTKGSVVVVPTLDQIRLTLIGSDEV